MSAVEPGGGAGPEAHPEGGPAGEPLSVPWSALRDYRCFGCSPHNPAGLRLRFYAHPEGLETVFRPGREFESYPGVVHGGLVSTVCDEAMGNLLVLRGGRSAFTVALRMRYLSPLAVGREYRCIARLRSGRDGTDMFHAAAEVLDADGAPMATATGSYQPVSMERARRHLMLTDDEARLLEDSLAASATPDLT